MNSNSKKLLEFVSLREKGQAIGENLGLSSVLLHGPSSEELFSWGLKLAFSCGFYDPIIVPEHLENCCGDRDKLELIINVFSEANQGPICIIFPSVETSLFKMRDDDERAMSIMVSEFIGRLEKLQNSGLGHLIILLSSMPWKMDQRILRSGRVEVHVMIDPSMPKELEVERYGKDLKDNECFLSSNDFQQDAIIKLNCDDSKWKLSHSIKDPQLTRSILREELEKSQGVQKWLVQFYLTYLFDIHPEEQMKEADILLDVFHDFDFNMSMLPATEQKYPAMIIHWIKSKCFKRHEMFMRLLLIDHINYGWLLNYWRWSSFEYSLDFLNDIFMSYDNPHCRYLVFNVSREWAGRDANIWYRWITEKAALIINVESDYNTKIMAIYLCFECGHLYENFFDPFKKLNISKEKSLEGLEHSLKIYPQLISREGHLIAIERLKAAIDEMRKSEAGIKQIEE